MYAEDSDDRLMNTILSEFYFPEHRLLSRIPLFLIHSKKDTIFIYNILPITFIFIFCVAIMI